MNPNDKVIRVLFAIISVSIFFLGTANAVDYYGSASGENMALASPEVSANVPSASAVLVRPIAPSGYCFNCLPSPRLIYTGKEDYTVSGTTYTRYNLAVSNRDGLSCQPLQTGSRPAPMWSQRQFCPDLGEHL